MDRLYLLAFLLTTDHAAAESCFVQGLEDATNSNRVFKEWADSWARRMIIQSAIQSVHPRPEEGGHSDLNSQREAEPLAIRAIVSLRAFERFVFVMSVLERYSDQDCSLLLDCTRGEVIAARTRALQQIASSEALYSEAATIAAREEVRRESGTRRESAPRLAYA
ncbi:MAG TPA: hypothetical protein VKB58_06055 [Terriglobales bacterium]|nr:hypothetical protein [Terriglobales bacterium]